MELPSLIGKKGMQDEEAAAIAALRSGDVDGLETLVRLHQVRALRVAANICRDDRQMAEDVVADAFLAVYRSARSFDESRPFLPWFYRIVVNTAGKALKQAAHEQPVDNGRNLLQEQADPGPGPELQMVSHEQTESLLRLMDALPVKQREVIVLRYYLDLDERSMSRVLGVPVGTVKWRLHAARKALRARLCETGDLGGYTWRERKTP